MVKSSRATREKLAHGLLKGFFAGAVYFAVIARGDKSHFKDRSRRCAKISARICKPCSEVTLGNELIEEGKDGITTWRESGLPIRDNVAKLHSFRTRVKFTD